MSNDKQIKHQEQEQLQLPQVRRGREDPVQDAQGKQSSARASPPKINFLIN
jgi:hypothetical protein